jgi:hypothetical protein
MNVNVIHWSLLGHLLFADMVEDEPSKSKKSKGLSHERIGTSDA